MLSVVILLSRRTILPYSRPLCVRLPELDQFFSINETVICQVFTYIIVFTVTQEGTRIVVRLLLVWSSVGFEVDIDLGRIGRAPYKQVVGKMQMKIRAVQRTVGVPLNNITCNYYPSVTILC